MKNKPTRLCICFVLIHFNFAMADVLPFNLEKSVEVQDARIQAQKRNKVSFSGFWDTRAGGRIQNDDTQRETSLTESRLKLKLKQSGERVSFGFNADLLYDDVAENHNIDLETGDGFVDLREANLRIQPSQNLDITVGRQKIKWGAGGLLAVNDRFPKDFRSFLLGRDIEYLRAPSDAVNITHASNLLNLDLVYSPRFDANRFIDGSKLSFFNRGLGRLSGRQEVLQPEVPSEWFQDDEIALRLSRNIRNFESALYAYQGFWKNPAGFNPTTRKLFFPKLKVLGFSVNGRLGPGKARLEFGYLDSLQDPRGNNPFVRNSETRIRVGYKTRLSKQTAVGIQYFLEHELDYKPGRPPTEAEDRHVLSTRIIHKSKNQKLKFTFIAFYSPSDDDGYFRPILNYQINKDWTVLGGANVFFGKNEHTFFGQLENNSNVYTGVRLSF